MLAIWPVFGIQLWITNDNNVSEKSRDTRKNCLCSQLNAADEKYTMGPLKLLRHLASVVQTLDSAIQRINHYPADSLISFPNSYSAIQRLNNQGLVLIFLLYFP